MIPGPLVAPRTPVAREPRAGVVARTVAVACFVLAAAGAWGWVTAWSPVGFTRWEVFETSSTMTLQPGTYVVYEEFDGASGPTTRQPLNVLVRSIAGREIDVTPLLGPSADPRASAAPADDPDAIHPDPYRTPWYEGRATAWFRIDRSGSYTITAFASRSATDSADYNELLTSFVALAPLGDPGPLGTGTGLMVVVFVPLAAGLAILVLARLRWPRPGRSARRSVPATP